MTDRKLAILKFIVAVKIIAIVIFVVLNLSGVTFGEKIGHAEEKTSTPTSASKANSEEDEEKRESNFLKEFLELKPLDSKGVEMDKIGKYLDLAERARVQVDARNKVLEAKTEQLQKLEKTLEEKIKTLEEERKYIEKTLQKEKQIQEDRLTALVELYVKMEPKKAAPVMEKMDKDLVVALFNKMKRKQITAILEAMTPEKAVEISQYYGRIGSAREYDLLKEMNISLRKAFNECKEIPKTQM